MSYINVSSPTITLELVLSRFSALGHTVKSYRNYYATNDPSREDNHPSLLFGETESGGVWFRDRAGKSSRGDILYALGLDPRSPHVEPPRFRRQPAKPKQRLRLDFSHPHATYNYVDSDGQPVYQVRRVNYAGGKELRQYRWQDGRWQPGRGDTPELLYNLPKVAEAEVVLIVEGEKDADSLNRLGYVATTHAGGAGNVDRTLEAYKAWLRDKRVIILPDNDQPGRDMAATLAGELDNASIVDPAAWGGDKADVSDLISRLRGELLEDSAIRATLDAILASATPYTRPVTLRDTFYAQRDDEIADLMRRNLPKFKPDVIPFMTPADYETIIRERQGVSGAADWRARVELDYPELDSEWEYRLKIQENKERKMAFCGTPFKRLTATGDIKAGRILCGLCESCKGLDRENLRQALTTVIWDDPETCLLIVTVDSKPERARVTRRLRDADLSYKVFPVATDYLTAYDILMPSAGAGIVADHSPRELLTLELNDARLNRWLETPEGERQSGELIPSRRKLREVGDLDTFERADPGPDTITLELQGIAADVELPAVFYDGEVYDAQSLQGALNKLAGLQRWKIIKGGHVIKGVITLRKHYSLNDMPAICELFNAKNAERRAKFEARRDKKPARSQLYTH